MKAAYTALWVSAKDVSCEMPTPARHLKAVVLVDATPPRFDSDALQRTPHGRDAVHGSRASLPPIRFVHDVFITLVATVITDLEGEGAED